MHVKNATALSDYLQKKKMKQGQIIPEDKTPLVSDDEVGRYQRHTFRQGWGFSEVQGRETPWYIIKITKKESIQNENNKCMGIYSNKKNIK